MDSIIRDPNGHDAANVQYDSVPNKGLLRTYSTIEEEARYVNENHQESYSLVLDNLTPTGADDCFCYIENGRSELMVIDSILLKKFTADDEVYIILGANGTRDTVTDIIPGNKHAGSAHGAEGTFEEGANLSGGGATITAASGVEIERINLINTLESKKYKFEAGLLVPKNQTLTLWAATGANAINATIHFFYHML